jgi:hypothetical protein
MSRPDWSRNDCEIALWSLAKYEEDIPPVFRADHGVTVITPHGLPRRGTTFHGAFMVAPLLLFMVVLALFPVFGFAGGWSIDATSAALTIVCALLLWGLVKALALLTKNRDLFPLRHFVTLGSAGIAVHFSRLHYPGGRKRAVIPREAVKTIRRSSGFYPPAALMGLGSVATVEIAAVNGDKIEIPMHPSKADSAAALSAVEEAIGTWLKKGG